MLFDFKAHKNINLFILSQFFSLIGERISTIAFVTLLANVDKVNSDRNVTLIGFFQILPVVVFSLIGGVLADKFNRRDYLIWINCLRLLIYLFFYFFILKYNSSTLSFLTIFFLGVFSALFNPAKKSFVPFLVVRSNEGMLKLANWILALSEILAMFLGILIGSLALNILSPISLILIDCCFFGVAILLMLQIKKNVDFIQPFKQNVFYEAKKTLRIVRNNRNLRILFLQLIFPFNLSAAFFYASISFWATKANPNNSGQSLGYFFLLIAIGAAMSYFIRRFFDKQNTGVAKDSEFKSLRTILFLGGLSLILLSLANYKFDFFTLCIAIITGIFIGLLYTRTNYLLQIYTEANFIGRIQGLSEIVFGLSFSIVIPLIVLCKTYFTPLKGLIIAGSILLFAAIQLTKKSSLKIKPDC